MEDRKYIIHSISIVGRSAQKTRAVEQEATFNPTVQDESNLDAMENSLGPIDIGR